jgi:hypothetical protein
MLIMKSPFIYILLMLVLWSCTKNTASGPNINHSIPVTTIIGNWSLVFDSTYTGVGTQNHAAVYSGQPGDYFNFSADGHVYTKEGNSLDTLKYSLLSASTIVIDSFGIALNGVPETSNITYQTYSDISVTIHQATIDAPVEPTPAGAFGRKVVLRK